MRSIGPRRCLRTSLAIAAILAFWTSPAPSAEPAAPAGDARAEALGLAFRFASSIDPDPKDKGKAQQAVLAEWIADGPLEEAMTRADSVEGWRRGVVYAEIAAALAKAGRTDEAKAWIEKAERFRESVEGWQNPRIAAHVAEARAAMGDLESARVAAKALAEGDALQYEGRAAATLAQAHAAKGDFAKAMEALRAVEAEDDLDLTWWRTSGYTALGREKKFSAEQRGEALRAARKSAEAFQGWKRAELLQSVAKEWIDLGEVETARALLRDAEALVAAADASAAPKAALLSNLARSFALAGEKDRAQELLGQAEGLVDKALLTERPLFWANLAESYAAAGNQDSAGRLFDRAIAATEELVNARPRALAAVAVCRAMAKAKLRLDGSRRARLDALLAGLKDPW